MMRGHYMLPVFVALVAAPNAQAWGQPSLSPNSSPQAQQGPSSPEVEKLIAELGSPNFNHRKAAAAALEAMGLPLLERLRQAKTDRDPEIALRARWLVDKLQSRLDYLLAEYLEYGLPLPPADAKLIRFSVGDTHKYLGFLLDAGSKTKLARVHMGTASIELQPYMPWEIVEPTADIVAGLNLGWNGSTSFSANDTLAIGLQCYARGWHELAEELWRRGIDQDTGHPYSRYRQPPGVSRRTALSYLAWSYLANEVAVPGADRADIARRMKRLLAADPESANPTHRGLLESLEATLVPFTSEPGTLERCVDELIDLPSDSSDYGNTPSYRRLAEAGFEAVPTLMKHIDDIRLTRGVDQMQNNRPGGHRFVAMICVGFLKQIGGHEVFQILWLGPDDEATRKAKLLAWWKAAQAEGEEAYMTRRILPDPEHEQSKRPNATMLSIIAKRYPNQLAGIYRRVLDERPDVEGRSIVELLVESSTADDLKRELYIRAAGHAKLEHRFDGLEQLAKIDPATFKTMLLQTLASLPTTPAGEYRWCPESRTATFVANSDDPDVWAAFLKQVKASDAGLRMEFFNQLAVEKVSRTPKRRLDLLAEFLNDRSAPDLDAAPEKFNSYCAALRFPGAEVRHIAAYSAASLLERTERPDKSWTPAQWDELIAGVKRDIARR